MADVNVYPGTKRRGGITYHIRRSPLVPTLEDKRTKGGAIPLILISTSYMGPLEASLTHTHSTHSTHIHMYLLNFTSCLKDQENSPCNLREKQAGGRGRRTGSALTAGLSNQPVKKGAGRGRAESQVATSRSTGEDHADNHGMSLCITHVRAQCVTFVCSFLPLLSNRQREFSCL